MHFFTSFYNKITPVSLCTVELALNLVIVIVPWFEGMIAILVLFQANEELAAASASVCSWAEWGFLISTSPRGDASS